MPGPALAIKPNYDFIQAKFLIIRTESSHVILEQSSANAKYPV